LGIKNVKYAKDQTWLLLVFIMVDSSMSCVISYGAYIRKRRKTCRGCIQDLFKATTSDYAQVLNKTMKNTRMNYSLDLEIGIS
jgi:hypothetical protein